MKLSEQIRGWALDLAYPPSQGTMETWAQQVARLESDLLYKESIMPKKKCNFCHKPEGGVTTMISSPVESEPKVFICDECVQVCHTLLHGRGEEKQSS
jgi:hypothetical protein